MKDHVGTLKDIEVDGSIAVVTIEVEGRNEAFYAETRLFCAAIEDAFGGDWLDQDIRFTTDMRIMTAFEPA